MRPLVDLVRDVRPEHLLEMARTVDQDVVEALPAHGPTNRSAKAFALGDRTGVRMTRTGFEHADAIREVSLPTAERADRWWRLSAGIARLDGVECELFAAPRRLRIRL
jgi:hypothetical protein